MNKPLASGKEFMKIAVFAIFLFSVVLGVGCRYDMQDQPRYKAYKESDFFADGKAMQDPPDGTIARGQLQENKALYTGKKADADPNAAIESSTDANGNTIVLSFPNDIDELPIPLTKELLERGEQRYRIFCIVCHGPVGNGDGMVVRRGFPKPPTYHDDRLRNAPVGHFFDVMTNGWGKMNSYSAQIPVADRWAIVSYIRALQASQNPNPAADGADSGEDPNKDNAQTDRTLESNGNEPTGNQGGGE